MLGSHCSFFLQHEDLGQEKLKSMYFLDPSESLGHRANYLEIWRYPQGDRVLEISSAGVGIIRLCKTVEGPK